MNNATIVRRLQVLAASTVITVLIAGCANLALEDAAERGPGNTAGAPDTQPAAQSGAGSDTQRGAEVIVHSGTSSESDDSADTLAAGTGPDAREKSVNRAIAAGQVLRQNPSGLAAGIAGGAFMRATARNVGRELASLSSDEELWIIATPDSQSGAAGLTDDEEPGSGAMVASFSDDIDATTGLPKQVPLPLKHTSVNAVINGYISAVNVTQNFENPFNEKIEAVYMFPLPEKSAVSEFLMIIGERKIRGILREKEEAEAVYREAKSQGYSASLLVQHRPNIFEQKVANIEPGKSIDVDIRYFHTLAYNDGWYSFVFPTVVGPRYNPPAHTDPIEAVSREETQDDPQIAAVRYLRPHERSAHDISINVEVNAGVAIEELRSSHQIAALRDVPAQAVVTLVNQAAMPNKDFILEFQVAGAMVKSNLLTYVDAESNQGYFTLMLYPPATVGLLARQPMELVFVLDCSGSMHGRPLEQAKNAVSAALSHLREDDTFQIIRFSDRASQFGPVPLPATAENLSAATRYLARLEGTGGTQMIEGVKAALEFPHDAARLRFVSFMTDGFIGDEANIIAAVHNRIGQSRIFSFGVGTSVNRYLMERMAKEGRGAVAYLAPHDSAADIMRDFFSRISHPALTDIEIDWGAMAVTDVYPARLPDMFVGRSVVVTGKFLGAADNVTVHGMAGGERQHFRLAGNADDPANVYVPKIWARLRIADLADRQTWQHDPHRELMAAIKSTALEHQLMSDYTSFVAVDTSRRTDGERGTTVHQAVPVPEGVRYETTVKERP